MLEIFQDYMSIGDKQDKRISAKIIVTCSRCGAEIIIYDKWCKYINWVARGKVTSKD